MQKVRAFSTLAETALSARTSPITVLGLIRPNTTTARHASTMTLTPVLPCTDHLNIQIHPSSPNPLQSPTFTIPPSLLSHLTTASSHLHDGRTVAVPTETVYGLAASSLNPEAVKRIYAIKNRPADNPLIIHVSSLDMLSRLLPPDYRLSKLYLALTSTFWPGPLTLLFPSPSPPPAPAPQTNAIRMPNHALALALIHHADLPLSAPSANSSGRPSPTKAQHVFNDLNGKEGLGCILDGGDCGVGVESTVIDGLAWKQGGGGYVDILRPGGLGVEEIARVVRDVDGGEVTEVRVHGRLWRSNAVAGSSQIPSATSSKPSPESQPKIKPEKALPPSTPGMKYRHYSPRVPVYLLLPSNTFPRASSLSSSSNSPSDIFRPIVTAVKNGKRRSKIGLMHYDNSPLSASLLDPDLQAEHDVEFVPVSLGVDATSAAQRLFSGMLALEGKRLSPEVEDGGESEPAVVDTMDDGVDAILVEGCSDEGLGLAVMERVGKAVGGGGKTGELGNGEGEGTQGRYWVQV